MNYFCQQSLKAIIKDYGKLVIFAKHNTNNPNPVIQGIWEDVRKSRASQVFQKRKREDDRKSIY
jgi:hypothetical protein